METRRLGAEGPVVSSIGLGCMGMSQSYGVRDDEESARTIARALDRGITFFDTADVYGAGTNETLVGRELGAKRREIIFATKCGLQLDDRAVPVRVNGRPEYIRQACEASLRRLGTDVIDLYYLHRVDKDVPIEESVGAMKALVEAGKVRHIGLSEASASTIRRAHAVHPITAVQSEYSLWFREPEERVLPACRELGIAFVPFSPLGKGFLTGTVTDTATLQPTDMRRSVPRFQDGNIQQNARLLAELRAIGDRLSATPAQVALAWVLAQGNDIVPIPGTKRRTYLDENIDALQLELDAATRATLDSLFHRGAVAGGRYSDAMERLIDRD